MTDSPSENIKCLVRCRPLNEKELGLGVKCINILPDEKTILVENKVEQKNDGRQCQYTMDKVFGEGVTQEELFEEIGMPIIASFLNGYNCTIFCYGQTGAGKTHTMMGPLDALYETKASSHGLIPRILDFIFNEKEKVNNIITNNTTEKCSKIKIDVKTCCMEIYQENIIDLLGTSNIAEMNGGKGGMMKDNNTQNEKLKVKEDSKRGMYIDGITEVPVSNAKEAKDVILKGLKSRHVAATAMNSESSRSHLIFTIYLNASYLRNEGGSVSKASRLHLIDLAGSERQKQTKAEGSRIKEAGMINKSLSSLGNVINALVENSEGKNKFVPFRDSKLTHFLKDSLGGNSKTTIVANISLSIIQINETISTLKFVQRAKMIKNKATLNVNVQENIQCLQEEIKKLKSILASHGITNLTKGDVPINLNEDGTSTVPSNYICPICHNESYEISETNIMLKLKQDLITLITTVSANFKCENTISNCFNNLTLELNNRGVQFVCAIDKYKKEYEESIKSLNNLIEKFSSFLENNQNDFQEIKTNIKNFKGTDIFDKIFMEKVSVLVDNVLLLKEKFDTCQVDELLELKTQNKLLLTENEAFNELKSTIENKQKLFELEGEISKNSNEISEIVSKFNKSNEDIKNYFSKNFVNSPIFKGELILMEQDQLDLLHLQINEGKSNERHLNKRIEELENENFLLSIDIIRLKERIKSLSSFPMKDKNEKEIKESKDNNSEEDKLSKVDSKESDSDSNESEEKDEIDIDTMRRTRRAQTTQRIRKGIFQATGTQREVSYSTLAEKKSKTYSIVGLSSTNVEIIRMKENLDNLQDQLNEKYYENNELNKQINEQKDTIETLNNNIQDMDSNIKSLKEENDTLNMTNEIFEKNIFELNQEKNEIYSIIDEVRAMNDKNKEDFSNLTAIYFNDMELIEKYYKVVVDKMNMNIRKNIDENIQEINKVKEEMDIKNKYNDQMFKEFNNFFEYIEKTMKVMMDKMEKIVIDKVKKENELKNELMEKNKNYQKNLSEKDNSIIELKEVKTFLSENVISLEKKINELSAIIEEKEKFIKNEENERNKVNEINNNLHKQIDEISQEKHNLQKDKDNLSNDIEELKKKHINEIFLLTKTKENEINTLNIEHKKEKEKLIKQNENSRNQIKELKEEKLKIKNDHEAQINNLNKEKENEITKLINNHSIEINNLSDEKQSLISTYENKIKDLSNAINEANNEIKEKTTIISAQSSELEVHKQTIKDNKITISNLQSTIEKTNLNVNTLSESKTQNEIAIKEKDEKIKSLIQIKEDLQLSLANIEKELFETKLNLILTSYQNEKNNDYYKYQKSQIDSIIKLKNTIISEQSNEIGAKNLNIKQNEKLIEKVMMKNEIAEKVMNMGKEMLTEFKTKIKKGTNLIIEDNQIEDFIINKGEGLKKERAQIERKIKQKSNFINEKTNQFFELVKGYLKNIGVYHEKNIQSISLRKNEIEKCTQIQNEIINTQIQIEHCNFYSNEKGQKLSLEHSETIKEMLNILINQIQNEIFCLHAHQLSTQAKKILNEEAKEQSEIVKSLDSMIEKYNTIYENLLHEMISIQTSFMKYKQETTHKIQLTSPQSIAYISEKKQKLTTQLSLLLNSQESISAGPLNPKSKPTIEIESLISQITSAQSEILQLTHRYAIFSILPEQFPQIRILLKQTETEKKNEILQEKLKIILGKKFNVDNLYNNTTPEVVWNTASIPKLSKKLLILKDQKQTLKNEINLLTCDFNKSLTNTAADSKIRMLFVIREENKKLKSEIADLRNKNKSLEVQIAKISELNEVNKNYNILLDTVLNESDSFNSINNSESFTTSKENKFKRAMNILKGK